MKQIKALFILLLLLPGINFISVGQVTLPEVKIISLNYKYLKSVDDSSAAQPVRLLEHKAASYDLKNAEFYEEEYDNYFVSFYIPQGLILAYYDNNGKMVQTTEKFKNVTLPKVLREAVTQRYPQWLIAKDVYFVQYYTDARGTKKIYKLLLENGSKRIRVKLNEIGSFIE